MASTLREVLPRRGAGCSAAGSGRARATSGSPCGGRPSPAAAAAAAGADRGPAGRRLHRRRRLHRAVDGDVAGPGRSLVAGRRARARGRRLRRIGPQRRLVLGALRHRGRRARPPARSRGHARHAPRHAGNGRCRGAERDDEGIDCHFEKGGTVDLVRSEAQRERAPAGVEEEHSSGSARTTCAGSPGGDAGARGRGGRLGATYTPHCAAMQPALWPGLADAVERRGVRLFEHTEVTDIRPAGAGPSRCTPGRHRPSRCGGACDGGVDAHPARGPPRDRARVLAHGGDRASRRRLLGGAGLETIGPRSPTTGT